ncbi:uncharacterized protein [Nothobranchius furzeri]|uniref:uncharacterized protein isoform X2 n=1 Tax=Nothobranchius furzeri TaxID=105023 RepID=UPI0039047D34
MHSVISTWGCLRHGLYAGGICLGPKPTSRRTPSEGRQNLPNSGRLLEPGFGTVHGIYYWERLSEDCGGSCTKTEKMFTLLTSMSWPPGGIHKSTCCVACRYVFVGFTPACLCLLICTNTCRKTLGPRTSCFFLLGVGRQVKLTIICSVRVAAFIDSGFWKEKTGRDLEFFPQQFMGNCCGTFMLMYALCICTSSPPSFTEEEMPAIRLWWCIQLMERFGIEGYGRHFRQTGTIIFAALVQARHQAWTKICLLDRRSIPSPPGNSPACLQGTKGNLLQV